MHRTLPKQASHSSVSGNSTEESHEVRHTLYILIAELPKRALCKLAFCRKCLDMHFQRLLPLTPEGLQTSTSATRSSSGEVEQLMRTLRQIRLWAQMHSGFSNRVHY